MFEEFKNIDFSCNQYLFHITTPEGESSVEARDGLLVTSGHIGEWECSNFMCLIDVLMGHGIEIDKHIYF